MSLPRRLEQLQDAGEVELTSFTEAGLVTVAVPSRVALRQVAAPSAPQAQLADLQGLVARGFVELSDAQSTSGVEDDKQAAALLGDLAIVVSLRSNPTSVAKVHQARHD